MSAVEAAQHAQEQRRETHIQRENTTHAKEAMHEVRYTARMQYKSQQERDRAAAIERSRQPRLPDKQEFDPVCTLCLLRVSLYLVC